MNIPSRRLRELIPGGAHTYSRGEDQFSPNSPPLLDGGAGVRVWTPQKKVFIDFGMALRAITLGYANSRVNAAAIQQIGLGNNLTRPSTIELEAAEAVVSHFPHIDMVKFAKNGSNVTTAAVKLARAYTGRSMVIIPEEQPFFSFDDWFISGTAMERGTDPNSSTNVVRVRFGDVEHLKRVMKANQGLVAAIMMEPIAGTLNPCGNHLNSDFRAQSPCISCKAPADSYLLQVQKIAKEDGALFILDEMITGFRWDLKGATDYFGLAPDLVTYGKAAANGFSLAFLGGKAEIMELGGIHQAGMERVFLLSSTHGGEMSSLGAMLETLSIYRTEGIVENLWSIAETYKQLFLDQILAHKLSDSVRIKGSSLLPVLTFLDEDGQASPYVRTVFQHAMVEKGILMPWISYSIGHKEPKVVSATMHAFTHALKEISRLRNDPGAAPFNSVDCVKPVFRKFN